MRTSVSKNQKKLAKMVKNAKKLVNHETRQKRKKIRRKQLKKCVKNAHCWKI